MAWVASTVSPKRYIGKPELRVKRVYLVKELTFSRPCHFVNVCRNKKVCMKSTWSLLCVYVWLCVCVCVFVCCLNDTWNDTWSCCTMHRELSTQALVWCREWCVAISHAAQAHYLNPSNFIWSGFGCSRDACVLILPQMVIVLLLSTSSFGVSWNMINNKECSLTQLGSIHVVAMMCVVVGTCGGWFSYLCCRNFWLKSSLQLVVNKWELVV